MKDIVLEGFEERHVVDTIMGEIAKLATDDEMWGAKLSVMKENLERHIEEEEDDMFKKARRLFDESKFKELGARMLARKQGSGG